MEMGFSMWALCTLVVMSMNLCDASKGHKVPKGHLHDIQQNHHRCFTEQDGITPEIIRRFIGRNVSWDNYTPVTLVHKLEDIDSKRKRRRKRSQDKRCPVLELQHSSSAERVDKRSLSPWSYHIDYDENRYPQKLAYAHCLCTGCIDGRFLKETFSLNSVELHQTMMVLVRKPCPSDSSAFTFELKYIQVPVGCTCVRPRKSYQQ